MLNYSGKQKRNTSQQNSAIHNSCIIYKLITKDDSNIYSTKQSSIAYRSSINPNLIKQTQQGKLTNEYEPKEVTDFIKNIYDGCLQNQNSEQLLDKNTQVFSFKNNKDSAVIRPKQIQDVSRNSVQSRARKTFLEKYHQIFVVDGKLQINDNKRLSASALSSYKWKSVLARRRSFNSSSQTPQSKEYPLTYQDYKLVAQAKDKTAKLINKDNYKTCDHKLSTSNFIKTFQTREEKLKIIYSTPPSEYTDILDYMNRVKSKDMPNSQALQESHMEIQLIKRRGRQDGQHNSGNDFKTQIITKNQIIPKQYDVFEVDTNKLCNSLVILKQKQRANSINIP